MRLIKNSMMAALTVLLVILPVITGCTSKSTPSPTVTTPAAATTSASRTATAMTPTPTPKRLVWGLTASMTGAGALWGKWISRAGQAAAEDVNNNGGVTIGNQTYFFDVKTYDHAFVPAQNIEAITKLITMDKANFILTHGAAATVATMPLINQNKIITFHMAASDQLLTDPGAYYFFREMPGVTETTKLVFQYTASAHPEVKTAVVIVTNDASGKGYAIPAEAEGPKAGIKMLPTEYFAANTTDFYPILTKVLAQKPDMIFTGATAPASLASLFKQARDMGYKGLFASGTVGAIDPVVTAVGPAGVEGWYFGSSQAFVAGSGNGTPEENKFMQSLKDKYGEDPIDSVITTAPAIYIMAQAMKKAQTLDTDILINTIANSNFEVLGRPTKFAGESVYKIKRQLDNGMTIVVVKSGKITAGPPQYLPAGY